MREGCIVLLLVSLLLALALAAALLIGGDNASAGFARALPDCEYTVVPLGANGFGLGNESIDAREDPHLIDSAQRYVCHEIVSIRDKASGWDLAGIDLMRIEGPAYDVDQWRANLRYTYGVYGTALARYLVLSVSEEPLQARYPPDLPLIREEARVNGYPGQIVRFGNAPDSVLVQWQQNGLALEAGVQLDDRFTLNDLLTLLRSVRLAN